MDLAKTSARRDHSNLSFGIECVLYYIIYGTCYCGTWLCVITVGCVLICICLCLWWKVRVCVLKKIQWINETHTSYIGLCHLWPLADHGTFQTSLLPSLPLVPHKTAEWANDERDAFLVGINLQHTPVYHTHVMGVDVVATLRSWKDGQPILMNIDTTFFFIWKLPS